MKRNICGILAALLLFAAFTHAVPAVAAGGDGADPAVMERAQAANEAEDYKEAMSIFLEALMQYPGVAEYQAGLGASLFDLGRFEEALEPLAAAVRLDPARWEFHHSYGVALYCTERKEEAAAAIRKAMERTPDKDDAHVSLVYIQLENGALEDAVRTCAEGLSAFPESASLWLMTGEAQFALGDYAQALDAFQKALFYGDFAEDDIKNYAEAKQKAGAQDRQAAQAPEATQAPEAPEDTQASKIMEILKAAQDSEAPEATQAPEAPEDTQASKIMEILKAAQDSQSTLPLPGEPSRLMNYENWLLQFVSALPIQGNFLDSFIESVSLGGGWVQDAVAYPREWPAQWLEGLVPEYTGTGWMFDLYVQHPATSYAAGDIRHVAVTVYGYLPEEADAYIARLPEYGFTEMPGDDGYTAEWIDSKRTFRGEDCVLNILFAHGAGPEFSISLDGNEDPEAPKPMIQFNVDFTRDPRKPDLSVAQGTDLLNFNEFADLMNWPADRRSSLGVVVESETDDYGRLNEMIYYPAAWPKDVFGDLIPEYRSAGMMYYMVVTAPEANPGRDQTLIASLYVVAFNGEDVEQYARELSAYGYRRAPEEEYDENTAALAADRSAYHLFQLPNVRCVVATFEDDDMDMLQINVRWDGRYSNFFNE